MLKQRLFPLLFCSLLAAPAMANNLESAAAAMSSGDYDKAKLLLRSEARSGDPQAWYLLGSVYTSTGEEDKALKFLKKAAESDHYLAATTLGKMYASGRGVKLDPDQAAIWFQKATQIAESQGEEEEDCE